MERGRALPVLSNPDAVDPPRPGTRGQAAALGTSKREQRWMLAQPREIRRSYVEAVLDRPEDPNAQERWMLLQIDRVRLSYVRDVLSHDRTARQSSRGCSSSRARYAPRTSVRCSTRSAAQYWRRAHT